MAIIDTTINKFIDNQLIKEYKKHQKEHEPSGLLSASMLYQPVRFQVFKTLGVPTKEFDPYVLAKFKRGKDVENWFIKQLNEAGLLITDKNKLESLNLEIKENKQAKGIYRETIGYIDSVIDTNKMQAKKGIIPNEIKSVTNAKIRRIKKGGVDWHYKIQACLYALAMKTEYYAITIISAEDLQNTTYIFKTRELKQEIDQIISRYKKAMEDWAKDRTIPKFEPNKKAAWTANIKYAMFDEFWIKESDKKIIKKMEELRII